MKVCHELDDIGDLVLGRQDGGAEVVRAGHLSEARAGHQHDAGGVQQLHAVQRIALHVLRSGGSNSLGCK